MATKELASELASKFGLHPARLFQNPSMRASTGSLADSVNDEAILAVSSLQCSFTSVYLSRWLISTNSLRREMDFALPEYLRTVDGTPWKCSMDARLEIDVGNKQRKLYGVANTTRVRGRS